MLIENRINSFESLSINKVSDLNLLTFALLTIKSSVKIIYEYLQLEDKVEIMILIAIKRYNTNKRKNSESTSVPKTGIKVKLLVREVPNFNSNLSKWVDWKQDILTIFGAIDLISIIEDYEVASGNS